MKLEDEIQKILSEKPEGMSVHDIARQLMENGVLNSNDSKVCYFQVHARTFNNSELFKRDGNLVKLKKKI